MNVWLKSKWALVLLAGLALAACGDDSDKDGGGGTTDPQACLGETDCDIAEYCIEGVCVSQGNECTEDEECGTDEECYGGYCVPFVPECTDDEQCADGKICLDQACTTGCRTTDDCSGDNVCLDNNVCGPAPIECGECGAHERCETSNGQCVPDGTCTSDDHCPAAQECDTGEGMCVPQVISCARNSDCPATTYCDRDSGECASGCRLSADCPVGGDVCVAGVCGAAPACEADDAEPNNASDSAAELSSGHSAEYTYCNDEDFYTFFVTAGDRVTLNVDFIHDEGNLNLDLLRPDGSRAQLAAGQADGEMITGFAVPDTGMYTARVYTTDRDTFTEYSLSLDVERFCSADSAEDDDTLETAVEIPFGQNVTGRTYCQSDDDWHYVDLYAGEVMDVTLAHAVADGDLSLAITDAEGTVISSADTPTDDEVINFTAAEAGRYFLQVSGADDAIAPYALNLDIQSGACEDNETANNNTGEAEWIVLGTPVSAQICNGDEDFYAVFLPADLELSVALEMVHTIGDLNVEVLNPGGTDVLATAASMDDNEALTVTTEVAGTHYIRVWGAGRAQNSYILTADADFDLACPGDDELEDNDTSDAAYAAAPGVYSPLVLCDDEDWFEITVGAGQSFEIIVSSSEEQEGVQVEVVPEAGDSTMYAQASGRIVHAEELVAGGTYKVKVSSSADGVYYSVNYAVYDGPLPLNCERNDDFEENNSPANATTVNQGDAFKAIVCDGDVDYYTLGSALSPSSIQMLFDNADGNLDLRVWQNGQVVAESLSETNNESAVVAKSGSPYVLEVALAEGATGGTVYEMGISALPNPAGTANCAGGVGPFEPNNDAAGAIALSNSPIEAWYCGDKDYYRVSAEAGDAISATVWNTCSSPLTLSIHNSQDTPVAGALGGANLRSLTYDVTDAGDYLFVVEHEGNTPPSCNYTFFWDVAGPSAGCTDDGNEANDTPNDATTLTDGDTLSGSLCGADEDWFVWPSIPNRSRGELLVTFEEGAEAIVEVYNGDGALVTTSYAQGFTHFVGLDGLADEHYVRVVPTGDASTTLPYTILYAAYSTIPPCNPDAFEPNESEGAATLLDPAEGPFNATHCAGDADWYVVNLPAGTGTIVITAEFDHTSKTLSMFKPDALFPSESAEVAPGEIEMSSLYTDFIGAPPPYVFTVRSDDLEAGTPYTLNIAFESGF